MAAALNPPAAAGAADAPGPQALARLYVDHHGWLQDWLRRRLGNAADAADLAHDAFVRLLVAPRRFDSPPAARVYLRTMANGLCVDLWRRREVEQAWRETLAARPEALAPSAEQQLLVLQALQEIDAMLRRLPPKTSRAFVLGVACGMTDAEVGQELGVSARMVRKHVARAMLHCLLLEAAASVGAPG
ncbi:sigma-70 family RNA polymerase sigma factor [Rubrivivax gelatinosus]|uniref:RNA polymerase subunit sigma n=1 Tax=Rubrivivax gelatinosus TaxID=28068 RepID=A0ABS1E2D5_RUBGE|nr:sigma-70 family RNA polymerase sigma factor [Rubrivivax gelatinosus]MBK1715908.1 RNA polymerase subunit sigma [Rubrivivax gelatinosus]